MFYDYQPGTWEWTCPACGHKQVFTVAGVTYHESMQPIMDNAKVNGTPIKEFFGDDILIICRG